MDSVGIFGKRAETVTLFAEPDQFRYAACPPIEHVFELSVHDSVTYVSVTRIVSLDRHTTGAYNVVGDDRG